MNRLKGILFTCLWAGGIAFAVLVVIAGVRGVWELAEWNDGQKEAELWQYRAVVRYVEEYPDLRLRFKRAMRDGTMSRAEFGGIYDIADERDDFKEQQERVRTKARCLKTLGLTGEGD